MPKLILNDIRCHIEDENDVGFLWALDRELSHMVQGAQHTRAYRGWMDPYDGVYKAWDGRNRLFDPDDMSFPLGLKNRVKEFYKKDDRALRVIDCRSPKSVGKAIDILPTLKEMNKVPRPYQIEAVETTRKNDHGIIRIPTGGGKTLIATMVTADIGKSTIIYVIGKDLLHQLYNFFKEVFPDINIGIIGDGFCEIGDINIASVWTVGQALGMKQSEILCESENDEVAIEPEKYGAIRDLLMSTKVNIIDECHMAACETIQAIAQHANPEHIYGMSASPWRDDNADIMIECILGHKIIDVSASDLIEQGYLVRPLIKFKRVPEYPASLKRQYKTVYKHYIVENEVRNKMIFDTTDMLINLGYKSLILYNSVRHGRILNKIISQKFPCVLLSGKDKMSVRERAKEDIENGKIRVIIASKIFDLGVDVPALSGLVIASSGKSSVRALQRIGRVLRPYKGKKQAAVVDFIDQAAYLKKHSQARKRIYEYEKGFRVQWPKMK